MVPKTTGCSNDGHQSKPLSNRSCFEQPKVIQAKRPAEKAIAGFTQSRTVVVVVGSSVSVACAGLARPTTTGDMFTWRAGRHTGLLWPNPANDHLFEPAAHNTIDRGPLSWIGGGIIALQRTLNRAHTLDLIGSDAGKPSSSPASS